MQQAATICVGNYIGAKNLPAAKMYAKMSVVCAFTYAIISVSILIIFKEPMIYLFSSSEEVNYQIRLVFGYLWMAIFIDYIGRGGQGII